MKTINRRMEKIAAALEILASDFNELREAVEGTGGYDEHLGRVDAAGEPVNSSTTSNSSDSTYLDPCGVVLPGDEWRFLVSKETRTFVVDRVQGDVAIFQEKHENGEHHYDGITTMLLPAYYRLISRPGLRHGGVVRVGDKWQNLNSGIVREVVKLGNFQGENGPWKSAIATFETGTWLFRRELTDNDHWVLIHREPEAMPSPEDLVGKWYRVNEPFKHEESNYHKGEVFKVLSCNPLKANVQSADFMCQSAAWVEDILANCVEIPAPKAEIDWQRRALDAEQKVTNQRKALGELQDRYNNTKDLHDALRERYTELYDEHRALLSTVETIRTSIEIMTADGTPAGGSNNG